MSPFEARYRAWWAPAAICLLTAVGCDAVQEDRHVEFSSSGNSVAFQHGSDGIYVADPETGKLQKVFDADPSVLAVSTPQWSDDETQALFTTARDADRPAAPQTAGTETVAAQRTAVSAPAAWDDAPEGRLFFPRPTVYTCWVFQRLADGTLTKPVRLFDAHCNHSGYVAANLAVRWDPPHKKVLYVDAESTTSHAVWSFDRETGGKTRLFPPAGQAEPVHVIADFLPDGSHIVCVATTARQSNTRPPRANGAKQAPRPNAAERAPLNLSGIWIGSTDGADWWHVAESAERDESQVPRGLSSLISQRPAPTRDGRLFAFLRDESAAADSKPRTTLFRARIADRKVEPIYKTIGVIRDLHWSPDGSKLGFIAGDPKPGLIIIDAKGRVHASTSGHLADVHLLRDFVGWNSTGDKLAWVDSEKLPAEWHANWAFLLPPDPLARDAVVVGPEAALEGNGTGSTPAGRTVASGLRFTFPQWSTKRDQISMWATFSPSHRSLAGELTGGLGLRLGDPAAIVDVANGTIRWLAINGDELAQVGHYFLAKHDFAEARRWYQQADKQLSKLEPLRPVDLRDGLSGTAARRKTFEFFYWYCLTKLGEPAEAAQRLARFDNAYHIEWEPAASQTPGDRGVRAEQSQPGTSDPALAWSSAKSRHEAERLVSICKALSIAQVILCVDGPDESHSWFARRLNSADATDQVGELMAISQLCLLSQQNRDYATLVTERLAPLLAETLEDSATTSASETPESPSAVRGAIAILAAHSMGPLFSDGFLKEIPTGFVGQLVPKWEALLSRSHSDVAALYVNLFLRASAVRLGHEKERAAATARIVHNPIMRLSVSSGQLERYFQWLQPRGGSVPDSRT